MTSNDGPRTRTAAIVGEQKSQTVLRAPATTEHHLSRTKRPELVPRPLGAPACDAAYSGRRTPRNPSADWCSSGKEEQARLLLLARSARASETFQLARRSTVFQYSGSRAEERSAECRSVNEGPLDGCAPEKPPPGWGGSQPLKPECRCSADGDGGPHRGVDQALRTARDPINRCSP
jgi:hypothetical protein